MQPKVSIIVPVYNVYDYLERCLNSLVNQTLKDIEIIIVNDGSKDNSENIINKYKKKYSKIIKYFKTENYGLSHARNLGLENASGEYISFVDSDDYIDLDMLEKMYKHAHDNNLNIVVCDYYKNANEKLELVRLNIDITDKKSIVLDSKTYAWNKLYKRSIFDTYNINFPEKLIFEDISSIYPLLINEDKVGYLSDALYYYTVSRKSSIMKNKKRDDLKIIEVLKLLNKRVDKKYKDLLCEINVRHIYYRFHDMRFHNTRKYNINFINEAFAFLNKNFPGWENTDYLKNNNNKKRKIYWYIRALIRR